MYTWTKFVRQKTNSEDVVVSATSKSVLLFPVEHAATGALLRHNLAGDKGQGREGEAETRASLARMGA